MLFQKRGFRFSRQWVIRAEAVPRRFHVAHKQKFLFPRNFYLVAECLVLDIEFLNRACGVRRVNIGFQLDLCRIGIETG